MDLTFTLVEKVGRKYPSLPIFVGLSIGIVLSQYLLYFTLLKLLLLLSSIFLYLTIIFFSSTFYKNFLLKLLLFLSVGLVSSYLHIYKLSLASNTMIPGERELKLKVVDLNAVGKDFKWMMKAQHYIYVKIEQCLYDGRFRNVNGGRAILYVRKEGIDNKLNSVEYGDILNVKGYAIPLCNSDYNRSYKMYLASRGVDYVIFPNVIKKIDSKKSDLINYDSFCLYIYKIRKRLLRLLIYKIRDPDIEAILAGTVLGYKSGLEKKLKSAFLDSGLAHILAISGLHMAVVALIFIIFFRFINIRVRYLILPIFLSIYLMLTGFQISAIRAFIMISIFMIFRALYIRDVALNSLFFAASFLLFFKPLSLFTPGFQYSFLITGFLIFGWPNINRYLSMVGEKGRWIRGRDRQSYKNIFEFCRQKIIKMVLGSFLAAIAAYGLTMFYRYRFNPYMPFVNLFVVPLLFPIFLFSSLKIITGILLGPQIASLFNLPIYYFIKYINWIAKAYSFDTIWINRSFFNWYIIFLYYTLIFIFIAAKRKSLKIFSFLSLMVIIFFAIFCGGFLRSKVLIFKPKGGKEISLVINHSYSDRPDVIGATGNSGYMVSNFLKMYGIGRVGKIIVIDGRKESYNNVKILLNRFKVDEILILKGVRFTKSLKKLVKFCKTKGIKCTVHVSLSSPELTIKMFKIGGLQLKELESFWDQCRLEVKEYKQIGEWILIFNESDNNRRVIKIYCSNKSQFYFL